MRKLIAAVAMAVTLGGFGAAPALADADGATTINLPAAVVVAQDGTIPLRIKYTCVQYAEPANLGDILTVFAFVGDLGVFTAYIPVTCDGTERRATLLLPTFGDVSGPTVLQFGHYGLAADGLGYGGVFVLVPVTIR